MVLLMLSPYTRLFLELASDNKSAASSIGEQGRVTSTANSISETGETGDSEV